MDLTCLKNGKKHDSPVNIRLVAKTPDIRFFSENTRSDVKTSDVATLAVRYYLLQEVKDCTIAMVRAAWPFAVQLLKYFPIENLPDEILFFQANLLSCQRIRIFPSLKTCIVFL